MLLIRKVKDAQEQKAMEYIISYYTTYPSNHCLVADSLTNQGICTESENAHLIAYLCNKQYIAYDDPNHLGFPHIRLLPAGITYLEDKSKEIQNRRRVTRRFWIELLVSALFGIIGAFLGAYLEKDYHWYTYLTGNEAAQPSSALSAPAESLQD